MALLSNNLYRDNKYKLDCEKKINYFEQNNPNDISENENKYGLESTTNLTNNLIKTKNNISNVYVKENNEYYSTTKISESHYKLIK